MLPKLSELKRDCKRIYFFGLGFIQVVVNDYERYHFYSSRLPPFVEEPHNHRYNFCSFVLKGKLQQTIYEVKLAPTGYGYNEAFTHLMRKENCKKGEVKALDKHELKVNVRELTSMILNEGSSYSIEHNQFHSVKPLGECITKLVRGEYRKEDAMVTRKKTQDELCPFSLEIPEEQLWAIVGEML